MCRNKEKVKSKKAKGTKRNTFSFFLFPFALCSRLHRDERGTISIVTVFTLLMFTMLLVMIVNVATHLDDKIKMQNAADAAGYSGGVVLARGMNGIAFTNHLLCDVFAMTAFLREGRDRNAERLTPEILDEWKRTGETFETADFEKFRDLGRAILDKVPKERGLVGAFGNLSEAAATYALPVFESILRDGLISSFQRNLVRTVPGLAQQATREIAYRHGLTRSELEQLQPGGIGGEDVGEQTGLLWRMTPVGVPNDDDPLTRTLPAVDPDPAQSDYQTLQDPQPYLETALTQRRELAKHYLERWTSDKLRIFDRDAEMSQFSNLWRIFTCAHLDKLLTEEYPLTNLPMVMRLTEDGTDVETMRQTGQQQAVNQHLEQTYQFLAVMYRRHISETGPGVFRNPLAREADSLAFAQVSLFVPRARRYLAGPGRADPDLNLGGTFGFDSGLELPAEPAAPSSPGEERWVRENWPSHWDLLNQNWTVKLVPATAPSIPGILQSHPGLESMDFRPPNLGGVTIQDINRVNTH